MAASLRPQEILLPVKAGLVVASLVLALLVNLLPASGWIALLRPDFVALVLLYWTIQQPHKTGFALAWALGLVMDVANGSLLGQHALAYGLLAFGGMVLSRRVRMFGLQAQIAHVVPVLLAAQGVVALVALAAGAAFPGWGWFLASVLGGLLWPVVGALLRLLRLPKPDPDAV